MKSPNTSHEFHYTLVGTAVFLCLFGALQWYKGQSLVSHNPMRYTAEAAAAFWKFGTIANPDYTPLYQTILRQSQEHPADYFWQDVFSVSISGTLLPQRGIGMAVLASPFWGAAEDGGLWFFNSLMFLALVSAVFRLTSSIASPKAAAITVAAAIITTPLIQAVYGFSHDLYLAACMMTSLALTSTHPVLGALLSVMSVETKQTALLFAPATFVLTPPLLRKRLLVSFAFFLSLLWCVQWKLWGSPFAISYDRVAYFVNGEVHIYNPVTLSWQIFTERWFDKFFCIPDGFICRNPLLPLALAGWILSPREILWRFTPALLGCALLFGLVHALRFTYIPGFIEHDQSIWDLFGNAPRYCLPISLLCYLGLGPLICRLLHGKPSHHRSLKLN